MIVSGGSAEAPGHPSWEPIAIVGMACRLPGAGDLGSFWRLLGEGREAISSPPERLGGGAAERGPAWGGYLHDAEWFDAAFFGVSRREAPAMDPQQRIMLEIGWEAVENARMAPRTLRGSRTGVFVGAINSDFALLQDRGGSEAITHHTLTGTHRSMIANRLSHTLGLRGPSLTVDSGQSSGLVGVHLAMESLRRGESDIALAGGVNLILVPESTEGVARFGGLSPTARSHTFDARADGYVRGEGGAVVVLKPLSRALADGDRVHAVIHGGAVEHAGGDAFLTRPTVEGQAAVMRAAYADAGKPPGQVAYVELHGTGTPVGDPVEAAALGEVFADEREEPLRVGSVKTNVGHLEGAAGIIGLVKTVLGIDHQQIPPTRNFERPNQGIDLERLGLSVQTRREPWPRHAPLAGVSSFGMGGTNCHLVLGPAPVNDRGTAAASPVPVPNPVPWVLSGRTEEALRAQASALHAHVSTHPGSDPADIGYSLITTRDVFEHRAVLFVSGEDGTRELESVRFEGGPLTTGQGPVLLFPGQGGQWTGMGRELLDGEGVLADAFNARLLECESALEPFVDWSLVSVLRGETDAPHLTGPLARVDVVQPVLWATMVSLARVWETLGVRPAAVIGHSQGELAAACVAGALELEEAARVVAMRSRALSSLSGGGGMASLSLSAEQAEELTASLPDLHVAAVNGPTSVVVSGHPDSLREAVEHCVDMGVHGGLVDVDYASHSPHVERIRPLVTDSLERVRWSSPRTPLYSTLTGAALGRTPLNTAYWYSALRNPVRFSDAIEASIADGHRIFIEVGPHPVLAHGVKGSLERSGVTGRVLETLRRDAGDQAQLLTAAAQAFTAGIDVDWSILFEGTSARRTDLPTYRFQRERFWPERSVVDRALDERELSAAGSTETTREPGSGPGTERTEPVLDLVLRHTARILEQDELGPGEQERAFRDLGFDSIMTLELGDELEEATGVRLEDTVLFEVPTPTALAAYLVDELDTDEILVTGEGEASDEEEVSTAPRRATVETVASRPPEDDPIAITAMSCRLPGGADSPEKLWRLVHEGVDATGDFPLNRGWDLERLYDPEPGLPGHTYTRRGGFLYDADLFDAGFFGISPREADAMDPQQRLLLETSWEAIGRAGLDHRDIRGDRVGVFVGAMPTDYGPRLADPAHGGDGGYRLTGSTLSVASGRIAYFLGLHGPALTIDTACSSSLVAIHQAAQAIRRGECEMALAGGATVMASPGMFLEFSAQRGLSADGRCRAFGAEADGTAWAEGAGVLLLEPLSRARRAGRPVLALLRGSAVNSDGASNGLTAPNRRAQEEVIRAALDAGGTRAAEVDLVEAHGTGTRLGDPIEAKALISVYGESRDAETEPLRLGSLKSNIGHAQAAAGVAGVIKMVQALRHGRVPRTLHAEEPSPQVDWKDSGVRLVSDDEPWPDTGRPRRAAVSSFGISGTNAHLVLEGVTDEGPPVSLVEPPFQRRRHWVEPVRVAAIPAEPEPTPDLFDAGLELVDGRRVFSGTIGDRSHPWVEDHRLLGRTVLPGTALLSLAAHVGAHSGARRVGELTLESPLILARGKPADLQAVVERADAQGRRAVSLYSRSSTNDAWVRHATGLLESDGPVPEPGAGAWPPAGAVEVEGFDPQEGYARLSRRGYAYGRHFQGLEAVWRRGETLFARVRAHSGADGGAFHGPHPAQLDAALHAVLLLAEEEGELLVPFSWSGVHLADRGIGSSSELRVGLERAAPGRYRLTAVDEHGHRLVEVEELALRPIGADGLPAAPGEEPRPYVLGWEETDTPLLGRPVPKGLPSLETLDLEGPVPDVVYCELPATALYSGETAVPEAVREGLRSALESVRAWLTDERTDHARLAVVTWRSVVALPEDRLSGMAAAPVWGLLRSVQKEHPDRVVLVDSDGSEASHGVMVEAVELGEPQVALRAGRVLTPSLTLVEGAEAPLPPGPAWCLARGGGDPADPTVGPAMAPVAAARAPLGDHEVRVAVRAAGVNPGDARSEALGMGDVLGSEAAGIVVDRGPQVRDLDIGDRVAGLVPGSFGPIAVADRRRLVRLPDTWDFLEGAATPLAAFSAYYALVDLASLRPGENVLVHTGTDPIGLVTVRLALHMGAEVFAIAPPHLRSTLAAWGVPEERFLSEDAEDPRETLLDVNGGQGMDIVVCAGSGTAVDTGLGLLRSPSDGGGPGGRLVEIGGSRSEEAEDLAWAYPGRSYLALDPFDVEPTRVGEILERVVRMRASGEVVTPRAVPYHMREVREALASASRGEAGKPVLVLPAPFPQDGTVLVTGGTGTLGHLIARHLVTGYGVRHLTLVSRNGAGTRGQDERTTELQRLGARVDVVSCDVADRDAAASLIARVTAERPLRAVVHTAGVLDDATVLSLDDEQLETVLRPKLDAAWNLHELTADLDLGAFVLFSSITGLLGSAGQANYAAANAFCDALAHHRRERGLPALSLAWGLWEESSGMTGHLDDADLGVLRRGGLLPMPSDRALLRFDEALHLGLPVIAPAALDTEADAPPPVDDGPSDATTGTTPGAADPEEAPLSPARLLGMAGPERDRLLLTHVRAHTGAVLGHGGGGDEIEPERPFRELGVDSLTAIELRNRLNKASGLRLPATAVFDHPTPKALARLMVRLTTAEAESDPVRARVPAQGGSERAGTGDDVPVAEDTDSGDIDSMDVDDLLNLALGAEDSPPGRESDGEQETADGHR
ncbi:type I polyketide synthase [Nocardiopsis sp. MG754419]|uniref:type I polyketide synthase n=1 Tax=Nocardiopsis sp. MG754419 TaxID=2259865 RepID=UPI001BA47E5A|nr:type I polyketide synthase [Nocardiopsis sp. MG754419]MBR8742212.1 type I polyketide synthase [Nocardiopsis sp. MG754419]